MWSLPGRTLDRDAVGRLHQDPLGPVEPGGVDAAVDQDAHLGFEWGGEVRGEENECGKHGPAGGSVLPCRRLSSFR
jgi:hypothetical protein